MPLIIPPAMQFQTSAGIPLRFGLAYFSETGTTTPVPVYQEAACTNEHTDPVVADAQGIFPPVYFDQDLGLIRCRVIPADGDLDNPLIDADPVNFVIPDDAFSNSADVVLTCTGNPTGADKWLGGVAFTRSLTFPAGFVGSRGKPPKVLPTADYTVTIKITNTTVGHAVCNHTTGAWTVTMVGLIDIPVGDGDEMDFYGPASTDATMADFGLTMKALAV